MTIAECPIDDTFIAPMTQTGSSTPGEGQTPALDDERQGVTSERIWSEVTQRPVNGWRHR